MGKSKKEKKHGKSEKKGGKSKKSKKGGGSHGKSEKKSEKSKKSKKGGESHGKSEKKSEKSEKPKKGGESHGKSGGEHQEKSSDCGGQDSNSQVSLDSDLLMQPVFGLHQEYKTLHPPCEKKDRIITRLGRKGPIRPLEEAMCEEDDCDVCNPCNRKKKNCNDSDGGCDPCKPKKRKKKKCRYSHSTFSRFTRKSSFRTRSFEDCISIQSTNYAPCDCGCGGSTRYSSRRGGRPSRGRRRKTNSGSILDELIAIPCFLIDAVANFVFD